MLLSCASGTANWARAVNATCAWIWQFSLGDICCTNKMHQHSWCQAAMLERENRRDSHWRQPWTSNSLALGSEMNTRNHPIGRATDIFPCWGFHCCFVKIGTMYYQGSQGFFPTTSLLRPSGSTPCVASSATTWVNLPNVGGQPTRMYQLRQWACNRHLGYGRTSALQYRLKNSTCVTLVQY